MEYFARVDVQSIVDVESFDELPERIVRKCCQYKSCGNTELLREDRSEFIRVEDGLFRRVSAVAYVRASNGDVYFSGTKDLQEMLERLNDPKLYPIAEA